MNNGKKISELNPVSKINDASCFPVLSNGGTKKITFGSLLDCILNELNVPKVADVEKLKTEIEALKPDVELNENNIILINKKIEEINKTDDKQDVTIAKYILLFEEMKKVYNEAVVSGGIVDSELNVNSVNAIQNKAVAKLIPAQTSEENKLADKNFVNSSIQTETANFRGNWKTFDDVPEDESLYPADYVGNKKPNVNDYLVVRDYNGEGTWRFKYIGKWEDNGKNGWKEEYQVNEKPFTSEQLASINSGITEQKVARYDGMTFPVGTILSGLYTEAPVGFLLCNGQEVAIADYPELYTVIGALAECQSENEGMFKLPDLREVVLVGAGTNDSLSIANHDTYNVGEFKDDQMQGHKHSNRGQISEGDSDGKYKAYVILNTRADNEMTGTPINDGVNGIPRTGSTTHGKQIGVTYILKY